MPHLGAIIHWPDGYETIDIDAARRLGIGVSNTADALTDAVADAALGLILMTVRSFAAAERYARAGRWSAEGPYPLARDVTGSRVGILGLGHIGSAIAQRLAGFNCAISYHNRRQLPNPGYPYAPSAVDLAKSVEVLVVAAAGSKNAANPKIWNSRSAPYAPAGPIQLRAKLPSGTEALTLNDASFGEYDSNASAISTASVMHKNPISSLKRLFPLGVNRRKRLSSAF